MTHKKHLEIQSKVHGVKKTILKVQMESNSNQIKITKINYISTTTT